MTTAQSVPAKIPARRGRPPGRSPYQEERRRQTSAAILSGAADVFSSKPYVSATIDDIIRAAGISRATFYGHFETKLALAVAIYDATGSDWHSHFDKLADWEKWDRSGLKRWIRELAGLYVAHGYVTTLVDQLAVFEDSFRARLQSDRYELVRRLGAVGVRGFAQAASAADDNAACRARAHLLLMRLDQVCGMIARGDGAPAIDREAFIDLLADELHGTLAGEG